MAFRYDVAGFRVRVEHSLPLTPEPFPGEYRSFVGMDEAGASACDLVVSLGPGEGGAVALPPGRPVVEASPWDLYREGSSRCVVWRGRVPALPRWRLDFTPGEGIARVACGAELVEREAGIERLRNPFLYPMDQLLMMYALAGRGQGIVHSAGLLQGGACIVAAGRSRAGKSTLSRCWSARHGGEALLSDDRVIVGAPTEEGAPPLAYGTPWPGELGAARNGRATVSALVFLAKAPVNRLVPITPREAVERLFPVTSIPWFDPEYMALALGNVERWVRSVPAYEFQFTPDAGAVNALEGLLATG